MTKGETVANVQAHSDAVWELVDPDAGVEQVATGFTFTEGPIWHPTEHHLLFSDMPGDVRRKYTPDGTVVEVMRPSNKCNGMTYDADLNLIVCEHVTSSLIRENTDGTREVLASHFEGKELNSPNDVVVGSDGSVYFSDPVVRAHARLRPRARAGPGLAGRVQGAAPGGGIELVVDRDQYDQPNGLCFSPDESLMYINDTMRGLINVYDVNPDGSLSGERLFCDGIGTGVIEDGIPDGMKCDEMGNIWVTGPGGVWIIGSDGERLGTVPVPENVGNLTWGGTDWHTLFMPSCTSLYTLRTRVGPRREPYMG